MAGVVLETLSNKKLITFALFMLILQIAAYLLGGLICKYTSVILKIFMYNSNIYWNEVSRSLGLQQSKCENETPFTRFRASNRPRPQGGPVLNSLIILFSPQPTIWLKAIAIVLSVCLSVRPSVNNYLVNTLKATILPRSQLYLAYS